MGGGSSIQQTKTSIEPLKIQPQTVQQPKVQKVDTKPNVLDKSLTTKNTQSKDKLNNSKVQTKNTTTIKQKQKQKSIQPIKKQSTQKTHSLQKQQTKLNRSITTTNTKKVDTKLNKQLLNKSLNKITQKRAQESLIKKQVINLPQISSTKSTGKKSTPNKPRSLDKIVNKQISKSTVAMKALQSKLYTGVNNFNNTISSSTFRQSNKKPISLSSSSVKKIGTTSNSKPKLTTVKSTVKNQQLAEVQPQNQQDHKIKTKTKSKKKKIDPKIHQLMKLYGI